MRTQAVATWIVVWMAAFAIVSCGDEGMPGLLGPQVPHDLDTEPDPDTAGDVDTDSDADSDADSDTDTDIDTDTDTDADTDTDTDSDTDADTDGDTDAALSCADAFSCLISSDGTGLASCLTGTDSEAQSLMLTLGSCLVSAGCIGSGTLYACAFENCSAEVTACMADS